MMPNSQDLHYFLMVAETQNLSRASERLGVVQPTLSQALKRLEESVGKSLFVRQQSGVTLTRAGEVLLNRAKALLQDWERLTLAISELDHIPSGKFVIGCHPSVALYSLKHFMRQLLEHGELELTLEHGLSREITEKIISRKVDIGLVINPVRHDDLVLKKLCSDRVGLWAHQRAPKDILIYDPGLLQAQELIRKMRKTTVFKRHLTSSNLEVIADLTANGNGVGILPERVASKYKNLTPFSQHWFTDELYLVYRADQSRTAGFKLIVDTITSRIS